ncbi:hypothetical protein ACWM6E_31880, partial [Cupriavidus necator]
MQLCRQAAIGSRVLVRKYARRLEIRDLKAYPGIKAIAAQLNVQLQALPGDEDGPFAHAFEAMC